MIRIGLVALMAALFAFPSMTHAQWVPGGVRVCPDTGSQYWPAITSDGAGGAIVVWQDLRSGVNSDIYAQRINRSGVRQWSKDGVVLAKTGMRALPNVWDRPHNVISDGAGGAIVVWYERASGTTLIKAQRVDGFGNVMWGGGGMQLSQWHVDYGEPVHTALASDGAGGAIFAWEDFRNEDDEDVYAQRIDASGRALWSSQGVAICTALWPQSDPVITSDGAGGAIISWLGSWSIYAQRVNAAGAVQWIVDGILIRGEPRDCYGVRIAPDGAGGAILVWSTSSGAPGDTVEAQRINAAGERQWSAPALQISSGNSPNIVSDGAGGAIITWGPNSRAQRISHSGAFQWGASGVALDLDYPEMVPAENGGAILVAYGDWVILAQRLDGAGLLQWPVGGVPVTTATSEPMESAAVSDAAGGVMVAFGDQIDGRCIRLQQLGPDGRTTDTTPPQITVDLDRNVLWPPNHALVTVCATVRVTDNLDPAPAFRLLDITVLDGKHAIDATADVRHAAIGEPDLCYDLCAERSGAGNGREYRIIYQANDAAGNLANDTASVRVPRSAASTVASSGMRVTELVSVHPNPYNPETTVDYALEGAQRVIIAIYDVRGSLVRRLVDQSKPAGSYSAIWNGADDVGRPTSSGIYFVRMIAGSYTETRKIVMLK